MRKLRQQIIAISHALHRMGWVANHDGNVTARLAAARFLATPTATSKADVHDRDLIEVDGHGARVAGTARPFSELAIHLAVYNARPDVGAVVHAHPPHATALGCSGSRLLERPFLAEAVVSIGASIPTLPFTASGTETAAAIAAAALDVDAVVCAGNGSFAWGADLEQAYLRLELVEHLARIATLAEATGGVKPLPEAAVSDLLAKRAKAGLGAAADRAAAASTPPRVIACAPAPHAEGVVVASPGERASRDRLAAAIREELLEVLREGEQ
jgi:L-fuculose-phosphate aldolase